MKYSIVPICLLLLVVGSSLFAQQKQPASERLSVDLTIYNANLALVREERHY